jgi:hypothetical protein
MVPGAHRARLATLPVAGLKVPSAVVLDPVFRHPVLAESLADEMTIHPYVPVTIPPVISGSPHKSGSWRRHGNHGRRGRRDFYFHPDGRESRKSNGTQKQSRRDGTPTSDGHIHG